MKRKLLIVLFLSVSVFVYSMEYFRSNSLGMLLERVGKPKTDMLRWYVVLETTADGDKRILYHNGSVSRVFIRVKKGGTTIVKEEEPPLLKKESFYKGMYLQKEITYDDDGNSTTIINLWKNNKLTGTESYSNNLLVYKDTYITGENGVLLEIRRVYSDGTVKTSGFNYGKGGMLSRWDSSPDKNTIYRYTKGKLSSVESYNNSDLLSVKTYGYDNSFSTVTSSGSKGNMTTVKRYDTQNRLVYEETGIEGGRGASIVEYTYTKDLLSKKIIKKPGLRELHKYTYDEKGNLETETVYRNKIQEKKIHYMEDGLRSETIYRDGNPFLRVFYKDGVITSRETSEQGGK